MLGSVAKYMKQILGAMRKAIADFDMIQDGDRIVVGVSGGKDSLALLYALRLYQRFSPEKFDLCGVTLDMGFEGLDMGPVADFCRKIDVPYTVVKTEIAKIVFDVRKEPNPCSLCAKMRRGALHNYVKDIGYNKIALGHHSDDVVETLFLSLFYEGRLATFTPVTYLSRKEIHNIRPFVYVKEKQIVSAVETHCLPVVKSPCPMDKNTKREEIKQILHGIYKEIPHARERVMTAIKNEENTKLWFGKCMNIEEGND